MDVPALVMQLAVAGPRQRQAAADALVAAGAAAVAPLVTALCDENSPVDDHACAAVLHRIGEPAFRPLVEALAAADSRAVMVRAGMALTGLQVTDKAVYVPLLRHPSPAVRDRVAIVFEDMGADALPYLPALVPLLADHDDVRGRAERALEKMGPGVVPALRELRRTSSRHRRHALTGLLEVGGWDALDAVDQALIRRLVRVKLAHEVPEPMEVCGSWYAVATADQAAVLDAFGLSDALPATMLLGESAWLYDHWHAADGPGARVYVSPALDGWTLVFGEPSDDAPLDRSADGAPAGTGCAAALSRRFGAAHRYHEEGEYNAWCIAEDGAVVRSYDVAESDRQIGPPLPAEEGYRLPHEHPYPDDAFDGIDPFDTAALRVRIQELDRELAVPDPCYASDIAARISVDPTTIGPHTRVGGHGVLALTARGRTNGWPPGALPL